MNAGYFFFLLFTRWFLASRDLAVSVLGEEEGISSNGFWKNTRLGAGGEHGQAGRTRGCRRPQREVCAGRAGACAAARGWAIVFLRLRLFICKVGFILFTHWSGFFLIQVSSSQRHIGLPAPGRPAHPPCPLRAASELWPRGFSALRAVPDQALPVPSWLLVRINRVHPTGSLNFQFRKEELESSLFSQDVSNNSGRTQVCVYHLWPLSG